MGFIAQMKVSADLKPDFIALRDALATLPVEEARAIVGAAITQARNPVPAEVPATSPQGTAATAAKIRTDSNAVLPTRRPSEPKPLEEGKVTIIVRNGNLLADTINGKRYPTDSRIQVSPDELQAIEAELSQRRKHYGLSHTRIERLEPA
jgi:hypothetical protein